MGHRQLLVVTRPFSGTNREKRLTRVAASGVCDILFQKKICCSFLTGCKSTTKKTQPTIAGEITEVDSLKAKADLETNSIKEKLNKE